MPIGDRIKSFRKEKKLNQTQFCSSIGISQGNLSDLESGRSKPSLETLLSIKKAYNVSLDWLTSEDVELSDNRYYQSDSLSEDEGELLDIYRELTPRSKEEVLTYLQVRWKMDFGKENRSTSRSGESGSDSDDNGGAIA